jgi:hypothetical protein
VTVTAAVAPGFRVPAVGDTDTHEAVTDLTFHWSAAPPMFAIVKSRRVSSLENAIVYVENWTPGMPSASEGGVSGSGDTGPPLLQDARPASRSRIDDAWRSLGMIRLTFMVLVMARPLQPFSVVGGRTDV